jgi:hypothetical protein
VQNGLEEREDVANISSVLVVNRAAYKLRQERLRPLMDALRSPRPQAPPGRGERAGAGA